MARIWNPSFLDALDDFPGHPTLTASGLMIANVRSVIRRL
jgi:hypothetical protein